MQIANSLCPKTVKRIIKGLYHSFINAAIFAGGIAGLEYISNVDFGNELVASIVVLIIPFLRNALIEYKEGQTQK